jgi:hypothetical protein
VYNNNQLFGHKMTSTASINHIISISGFPKSGNTWISQMLHHLFGTYYQPDFSLSIPSHGNDIHQLLKHKISPVAVVKDHDVGQIHIIKSHFQYSHLLSQLAMLWPENHIKYAHLYVTRHPLEVLLSYLNYLRNIIARQGCVETTSHAIYLRELGFTLSLAEFTKLSLEDHSSSGFLDAVASRFIEDNLVIPPIYKISGSWIQNAQSFSYMPCHVMSYEQLCQADKSSIGRGISLFLNQNLDIQLSPDNVIMSLPLLRQPLLGLSQ